MGICNSSMFCCTLLYVHSSIAIILMGKRELVALLNLSSWCLMMVERPRQYMLRSVKYVTTNADVERALSLKKIAKNDHLYLSLPERVVTYSDTYIYYLLFIFAVTLLPHGMPCPGLL